MVDDHFVDEANDHDVIGLGVINFDEDKEGFC